MQIKILLKKHKKKVKQLLRKDENLLQNTHKKDLFPTLEKTAGSTETLKKNK